MAKKPRFFILRKSGVSIIFKVKGEVQAEPMSGIRCSCCDKDLQPVADVCQTGMFDDAYTTVMVCFDCGTAWEYKYNIANYLIMSKREQKESGFLISKKPPAKPGKASG